MNDIAGLPPGGQQVAGNRSHVVPNPDRSLGISFHAWIVIGGRLLAGADSVAAL